MKQYVVQKKVQAVSQMHVYKVLDDMIKEKGVDKVFNVNEIPKSVPTVNVMYIEDGAVHVMIAFRNDLEGVGMAESCFEFLAGKLGLLDEDSDDDTLMMEIAEGLEKGSFVKDNKMLFMVESMPMEDVDHMQEILEALEEDNDYTGVVD